MLTAYRPLNACTATVVRFILRLQYTLYHGRRTRCSTAAVLLSLRHNGRTVKSKKSVENKKRTQAIGLCPLNNMML